MRQIASYRTDQHFNMRVFITILFIIGIVFGSVDFKYAGGWPNSSSTKHTDVSIQLDCPGNPGCDCDDNTSCKDSSCIKHFKGNFCSLQEGDYFPSFKAYDQFGDIVSIHDFANQNKYILIEMGAAWCGPCRMLADWFSYGIEDLKSKPFWKNEYDMIYDLVRNEQIYFITIIYEDEFRDNSTQYTCEEWYNNYPDEFIPILADENKYLHKIIKPTGIPAISLLNDQMQIITLSTRGFNKAFDKLIELKLDQ